MLPVTIMVGFVLHYWAFSNLTRWFSQWNMAGKSSIWNITPHPCFCMLLFHEDAVSFHVILSLSLDCVTPNDPIEMFGTTHESLLLGCLTCWWSEQQLEGDYDLDDDMLRWVLCYWYQVMNIFPWIKPKLIWRTTFLNRNAIHKWVVSIC